MEQSVTTVVTRTVKPGREADYERWLSGVVRVAATFPGYLGATVLRPRPGSREWVLIFRYDTVDHLRAWEESRERAEWVARAGELCERTEIAKMTGLEAWFVLPGATVVLPPPKWKMVLVTWIVAVPTIQLLSFALRPLRDVLPTFAFVACLGLAMVTSMTYLLMPFATRIFGRFLYPKGPS